MNLSAIALLNMGLLTSSRDMINGMILIDTGILILFLFIAYLFISVKTNKQNKQNKESDNNGFYDKFY